MDWTHWLRGTACEGVPTRSSLVAATTPGVLRDRGAPALTLSSAAPAQSPGHGLPVRKSRLDGTRLLDVKATGWYPSLLRATVKRKGSETRQVVVDSALQLFSVKGYHNTSISDILAATGLTKGGLYAHFGSKEELWDAAYERAVEIWTGIVFRDAGSAADPLDRIARVLENDLREYVAGRVFRGGCIFFNLLVELSGQDQPMADRILRGYDGFSRVLARWLDEAKAAGILRAEADSAEIADFIVVVLNGATALFSARQDERVLEQALRQLRQHLDGWRT